MIDKEIIKIASRTEFVGLKKICTHKSFAKNSLCGDQIKIELVVNKTKIKSMRYETQSCILCEASASLLARKIKNVYLKDLKESIKKIKNIKKTGKFYFPAKFKEFSKLLNKKSLGRINCVILPMEALLKAIKVK